ncbi:MAG: hypothetical protein CMJ18_05845 [Phycisphaeraceae bacterium]|nr:hypothetical protein [Phycisphaeraceae bacterium]
MEIFLIYGGVIVVLVVLGILFYLRAVASRRRMRCPQCGETVQVELMEASHCSSCGAPLKNG